MSITENVLTLYGSMFEAIAKLRESLAEEGVSQEIIDKVIGTPDENETQNLSQTYGRLLSPNNSKESKESKEVAKPVKGNFTDSTVAKADATSTTKQSWIGKTGVVIVTDYTVKEHAIFGDFAKAYVQFKDKYLKQHGCYQYHNKLVFGAGWRMTDKTKLPDLRKALKADKIPFREVSRDDFTKELSKKASSTDVPEMSEEEIPQEKIEKVKKVTTKSKQAEEKPEPKKQGKTQEKVQEKVQEKKAPVKSESKLSAKSTKAEPEKKPAAKEQVKSKPKILKNSYGNFEEEGTGLVFIKLPIGADGKLLNVCVGYQFPSEKGEKGTKTIYALTEEHIEAAMNNSHKILDDDMIEKVKEVDPALAEELEEISIRGIDVDENEDDDGDEELIEDEDDVDVDDEEDDS